MTLSEAEFLPTWLLSPKQTEGYTYLGTRVAPKPMERLWDILQKLGNGSSKLGRSVGWLTAVGPLTQPRSRARGLLGPNRREARGREDRGGAERRKGGAGRSLGAQLPALGDKVDVIKGEGDFQVEGPGERRFLSEDRR